MAELCGGAEDSQDRRAALPLRAAIAASFLQSLEECTAPLAGRASAAVATSVDSRSSDGYTQVKDTCSALIVDARRVEWLFLAYREADTPTNNVRHNLNLPPPVSSICSGRMLVVALGESDTFCSP